MKILIIGSDYNWSIERIFQRELEALGNKVELVAVQNKFYDYYYKSILHKQIYRVGLSAILIRIYRILLTKVENEHYDLIWVFKGMEIFPETLIKLKKRTNKLINYNPDNPFIFSGTGSGNQNVTNCISLFCLHLTYDAWVKNENVIISGFINHSVIGATRCLSLNEAMNLGLPLLLFSTFALFYDLIENKKNFTFQ